MFLGLDRTGVGDFVRLSTWFGCGSAVALLGLASFDYGRKLRGHMHR
jgi:hypothetical protein